MMARVNLFIAALLWTVPAVAGTVGTEAPQLDQRILFRMVGNLYNVDPDLLTAIAAVESGGNGNAISPKGAEGLMQLMPETARRFSVEDPFDVIDNLFGAVRYLVHLQRWEMQRAGPDGSAADVLAAYNAGEAAVEKYHGIPPYAETQQYVRKVLLAYLLTGLVDISEVPLSRSPIAKHRVRPSVSSQIWQSTVALPKVGGSWLKSGVRGSPLVDVFTQLAEIKQARDSLIHERIKQAEEHSQH